MAYKKNWQSSKCTIQEAALLLRTVAQEYTDQRFTVRIITDDGGKHLAVYAEYGENGEDPYHCEVDTRFMGWRTVWFQLPSGYIDTIMEAKDAE
jgi:hypothetical protein